MAWNHIISCRSIVCSADFHIILLFIYLFIYQLAFLSLKTKCFDSNPYWCSNSFLPHSSSWADSCFFPNFYVIIIIIISFKTVNNQPVEKVKISDNGALATGSRNLCDDMWGSDESTCGFDKDADGNAIWDSQVKQRVPHSLHKMSSALFTLVFHFSCTKLFATVIRFGDQGGGGGWGLWGRRQLGNGGHGTQEKFR